MSLVVDEHRQYLADHARVDAFRRAIFETVRPGDVVVDLGSGTGILGFFACQAGARHVYCIEAGGMIQIARAVAQANGFADRVTFVPELSPQATLPERADVVMGDLIGRFGFDAGLWEYFPDACRRFLKPEGRLIPRAVTLVAAPVEAPDLHANVHFWRERPAGLDFDAAAEWALNTGYPAHVPHSALLGAGAPLVRVDTSSLEAVSLTGTVSRIIERDGTLHGVCGWFEAQLSPSVTMTNAPENPHRINRRAVFLPIKEPTTLRRGDEVRMTVVVNPAETVLAWAVHVRSQSGRIVTFRHSTVRGMLFGPEDLRRMDPEFRPSLTPRGVARRTVLELCDGGRPLQAIEAEVFDRHRDLFSSPAEAAVFVGEVVSRYSA